MESSPDFKAILETLSCPVHQRHPEIVILDDDGIKLNCCCVDFNNQCFYLLKKLIAGQPIENAVAQWKVANNK